MIISKYVVQNFKKSLSDIFEISVKNTLLGMWWMIPWIWHILLSCDRDTILRYSIRNEPTSSCTWTWQNSARKWISHFCHFFHLNHNSSPLLIMWLSMLCLGSVLRVLLDQSLHLLSKQWSRASCQYSALMYLRVSAAL